MLAQLATALAKATAVPLAAEAPSYPGWVTDSGSLSSPDEPEEP